MLIDALNIYDYLKNLIAVFDDFGLPIDHSKLEKQDAVIEICGLIVILNVRNDGEKNCEEDRIFFYHFIED